MSDAELVGCVPPLTAEARELSPVEPGVRLRLSNPMVLSAPVAVASERDDASASVDAAAELAGASGLPVESSGARLGPASLTVKVKDAVVSVTPLYIIVTEGHKLSVAKGAPDLGKQYCSTTDAADAVPDCASLRPTIALAARRRRDIVMAKDVASLHTRPAESTVSYS
jgi:hypothetical protein